MPWIKETEQENNQIQLEHKPVYAKRAAKEIDPDSIFPFGKHKTEGTKIRDVPPGYFIWFMEQPWAKDWTDLYAYCIENQRTFMKSSRPDQPYPKDFGDDNINYG